MKTKAAIPTGTMTADEFFDWANLPKNRDKFYELEQGKVVKMPPPGEAHGMVCMYVGALLLDYVRQTGRGRLMSNDTGLLVQKEPDTLRGPDIMLMMDNKTLDAVSKRYVKEIPALVVEVLSPNDRIGKTMKRVQQYLERGIKLVWLVDPEDRTITAYRRKELPKVYDDTDIVTGNGVLPGFKCIAADFFRLSGTKPIGKNIP